MAETTLNVTGSNIGTAFQTLLMCDELVPGHDTTYELCKLIYLYHPLGAKIVEGPIAIAQSQKRELTIQDSSAQERVAEQFQKVWDEYHVDSHIFNVYRTARIYGVATLVYGAEGVDTDQVIPLDKLSGLSLYFNVLDPLNTAGSMVFNQDPNSPNFQRVESVSVQGKTYHRSRCQVVMNESPIYIHYEASAFGYAGRSAYQRALFPLKTFIQSMITDDMITRKAGVLVAKLKGAGSVIDNIMAAVSGVKRALLKSSATNQVLSIDITESIETLNMQNADAASAQARTTLSRTSRRPCRCRRSCSTLRPSLRGLARGPKTPSTWRATSIGSASRCDLSMRSLTSSSSIWRGTKSSTRSSRRSSLSNTAT